MDANRRAADNSRDAARRSVEELAAVAEPLGVRDRAGSDAERVVAGGLARAFRRTSDSTTADVGICLDFGHAHIDGDLVEAIETVSEHLIAAEVHDNSGRSDDHLVPFEGSIDWPAALTSVQKVGYDGALMLRDQRRGLDERNRWRALGKAREKMERLLAD